MPGFVIPGTVVSPHVTGASERMWRPRHDVGVTSPGAGSDGTWPP